MLVKSLGAADNFVRKPNEMLIKSQLAVVDRLASFYHEQKADDELHAVAERSRARRARSADCRLQERAIGGRRSGSHPAQHTLPVSFSTTAA